MEKLEVKMNKLTAFAHSAGIKRIDIVDNIEAYGYVYFDIAVIDLNIDNTEEEMLATMCHELGHWIIYSLGLRKLLFLRYNRFLDELTADLVGNLVRIFVAGRDNLSNASWKKFKQSIVRR